MNKQKLKDYASWYYFKYFPSKKRLFEKVYKKSQDNTPLSQEVIAELEEYIDEAKNIDARVRFMLERNKNTQAIESNLLSKGYDKTIIKDIIEQYLKESGGSLLQEKSVQAKIIQYLKKWKSRQYIFQHLCETKQDREIVNHAFISLWISSEQENIEKEYRKLQGRYEKPQIIQKLLWKWFHYEDIKAFIEANTWQI